MIRFAPVMSPIPLKSRPTKIPVKKRKLGFAGKDEFYSTNDVSISIPGLEYGETSAREEITAPPAKRVTRRASAALTFPIESTTLVNPAPVAIPAAPPKARFRTSTPEEIFDNPTAAGKVFTTNQVNWAVRMLDAYLEGLASFYTDEIDAQLFARFPNLTDIEVDIATPAQDPIVVEGFVDAVLGGWFAGICGGLYWEAASPKATAAALETVEEMLAQVGEMRMKIAAGIGVLSGDIEVEEVEDSASEICGEEAESEEFEFAIEKGSEAQESSSDISQWSAEESESE